MLKPLPSPPQSILELDSSSIANFVAATADIIMIVDADGLIADVTYGGDGALKSVLGSLKGQRWDSVTGPDSRSKAQQLLIDAAGGILMRPREINFSATGHGGGVTIPLRLTAVWTWLDGRIALLGQDLRSVSGLQQRLLQAQQSLERELARVRQAETRHRVVFHSAAEPFLVVDSAMQRVVDANPAALGALGQRPDKIVGRHLTQIFEAASAGALHVLATGATMPGREGPTVVTKDGRRFIAGAVPFREDGNGLCLIRLGASVDEAAVDAAGEARVADLLAKLPIAVLLVDARFDIVSANPAFLDLTRLAHAEQAIGQSINRWIGRTVAEADALEDLVRSRHSVERHATILRGEFGTTEDIEITAARLEQGRFYAALLLRPQTARRATGLVPGGALPRSSDQMRDIVGRAPLKDIVRETTDIIERLSIEAALDLTGDNRAAAAELLGLSRQSLYSKMRRFGIGDLGAGVDHAGEANSGPRTRD